MLKHVVDAPFRSRWVGIAGDQSFVAALLPHAELGGHGDHQLLPVGHKSNPINRGVLQGSLLTPCFDRCFDEFLQWSPFLSPELAQLDGSPQSRGIRGETDVRKVAASIARGKAHDAAVVGYAAPNSAGVISILQKSEFAVVDAGGGSQAQHISCQGNVRHR